VFTATCGLAWFKEHNYLPTYSMEQRRSWEANQSLQLVKKFPSFLWNPKVLYRNHKCLLEHNTILLFSLLYVDLIKDNLVCNSSSWDASEVDSPVYHFIPISLVFHLTTVYSYRQPGLCIHKVCECGRASSLSRLRRTVRCRISRNFDVVPLAQREYLTLHVCTHHQISE
jgi:hypothetical protein